MSYPGSEPNSATGVPAFSWIAEVTVDGPGGWTHGDWGRGCGGMFGSIERVIAAAERESLRARQQTAVGFAIDELNTTRSTITPGAQAQVCTG